MTADYRLPTDGALRCFVTCWYEYANAISLSSSHARPKNVTPAGSVPPRVSPIGTLIDGNPVTGEKN